MVRRKPHNSGAQHPGRQYSDRQHSGSQGEEEPSRSPSLRSSFGHPARSAANKKPRPAPRSCWLRIVAGDMRGRKVHYCGDWHTRPMKDRTRESIFSRLGGYLDDTIALDLFAGTGILGIESISRHAKYAVLVELQRSALNDIRQNVTTLGIDKKVEIHAADTFAWIESLETRCKLWPALPWIVFISPPYELWHSQTADLLKLVDKVIAHAPPGSQIAIELCEKFDENLLPTSLEWDVRPAPPASMALADVPPLPTPQEPE